MEKKYEQALNNLDAQASLLLGTFDEGKNYLIDDKTLQSLLNCRKLIKSYKEDMIIAEAKIGSFKFNFNIYIQLGQDNKKRAGMFIVENAKLGFADKELQTYIASVILENDGSFITEVKKYFHLFTVDESTGVDMDNLELLELINKLKTLKDNYEAMMFLFVDLDREYVMKIMALLRRSGYYGTKLLEEFGNQVRAKGLNKLDPAYWRNLKVMLDTILINNKGMFDPDIQSQIDRLQKEFIEKSKNIKITEAKKEKSASKKAASKKSGAAGGGSKKKDKKAEESSTPSNDNKSESKSPSSAKTSFSFERSSVKNEGVGTFEHIGANINCEEDNSAKKFNHIVELGKEAGRKPFDRKRSETRRASRSSSGPEMAM